MKKTIFCVIALGMSVATVYGQDEVTAINTGAANFLTIMPDARTAALAGAGVSLTGNENAIFLNGATIAADKNCRGGASYTYAPWMRDYQSGYSLHALGGFYKIDEKNVILAGFRYYNYPKLGVLETGGVSIRPKELAAEVGYARELIKNLSVSATFRYIYSDMGKVGNDRGASTVAFDLGAFYTKAIARMEGASWSAGLQVSNLGPKIKYPKSSESLPMMAKVGGSVDLPFSQMHRLMMTADLGYRLAPSDVQAVNVSAGAEYTLAEHFMFRGGYHYGDKEKGDHSFATVGAGMNRYGGHLDFAWLFASDDCPFRNTFWATLGYSF